MLDSLFNLCQSTSPDSLINSKDKKRLTAIIAVIAVICVIAGAFTLSGKDNTNKLIIETSPDFPPIDMVSEGDYAGVELDILHAICEDMGYDYEIRQNAFDAILMSVQNHKCDIGASGFTINEERKDSVLFSDEYFQVHQVIVAKKGLDISSVDDVRNKVISVQSSTTGAKYAATISSNITHQTSYATVIEDLLTNKAYCEVVDNAVAMSQVASHPELEIYDVITDVDEEYYGFIFAKDNEELRDKFNESFRKLVNNGTVDAIKDYYYENNYLESTPSYFSYKGTITIETSPDFFPFDYQVGSEYTGIDIDLMRAVCKDMQYRLVIKQNDFDSILISVQNHKCDIGASGVSIDEDRKKSVLFSDSYAEIKQVAVVKDDSGLNTHDDLIGKRASSQTGSTGAEYAESLGGTLITQKSYAAALYEVISGKADCEIVDNLVAEAQVANNKGLKIIELPDAETEYFAFAFAKDNEALRDKVNESLAKLKANGTLDKIVSYYSENADNADSLHSYYNQQDINKKDSGDGFWDRFKHDFIENERYNYIFQGLKNTLKITVIALILGLIIGAVVAMVRSTHDQNGRFRIINAVCKLYITVIRGTPVMVQLMLIYYVVFASVNLNQILIAGVAFGLNSGAYVAEVIRSGINAVPKGQMEACRSLGMTDKMAMKTVIMPQAFRNIMPALGNEGITLLKETSVAGYIGIMDLTRGADIIRGQTYDALLPLIVIALIYLAFVLVLQYLVGRLEKRLNDAY